MSVPNPARIKEIQSYVDAHPTHGERRIAKALGVPRGSMPRLLKHIQRSQHVTLIGTSGGVRNDTAKEILGDERVIECEPCNSIRTLEDLISKTETNLDIWEVDHHIVNKHDLAYKDETGNAHVVELFQVKAWLKRKAGPADSEVISELWEELKRQKMPAMSKTVAPRQKSDKLLEISIPDLHYGSLSWHAETDEDYDSSIAEKRFLEAVQSLIEKGLVFGFSRALFPIGSDFFHIDTPANTTAAGTPLDADTRWQRSFVRGVKVVRTAIEMIRKHAPVDILVISGNHDTTRAFYLGELIASVYENYGDVTVNNSPKTRKYFQWGTNLLGFAHGNNEKAASLPNLMAGEMPQAWAATTHREWHVGHLHHSKEHWFEAGREQNATRIRTLPSLCGTDAWHKKQGYVGARKAAEAYLWSKLDGYVGHFSFSPR
jgi:hypothetical protein